MVGKTPSDDCWMWWRWLCCLLSPVKPSKMTADLGSVQSNDCYDVIHCQMTVVLAVVQVNQTTSGGGTTDPMTAVYGKQTIVRCLLTGA